jgi:hypothetical protein
MRYARQAVHFAISSVGLAVWGVAMALMCVCIPLARATRRVLPDSEWQNCWLASLWKWDRYGGYLAVRPADAVRFLKCLPVPHVIWIMELPRRGVRLEQYIPIKRKRAKWLPWFTGYFKGRTIHFDSNHAADMERYYAEMRSAEDSQQQ